GEWRWTPTVYGFFTERPNTNARKGVIASLISEYRPDDTLVARGEVAIGGSSIGASSELRYDDVRDQGRIRLVYKPEDFPTLGIADLRGTHGEAFWNRRQSDRLTITANANYDRFHLFTSTQRTAFGSVGLRYAVTPSLSVLSGAEFS